jgi:hypothetical protein
MGELTLMSFTLDCEYQEMVIKIDTDDSDDISIFQLKVFIYGTGLVSLFDEDESVSIKTLIWMSILFPTPLQLMPWLLLT